MNSMPTSDDISLQRRHNFHLEGPAGTTIRVLHGEVWITRHYDTEDHVLVAGDVLQHPGRGKTLITATKDARVRIHAPDVRVSSWAALFCRFVRPTSRAA